MKFMVKRYKTLQDFETALNSEVKSGYILESWNIDGTWGVVAVFVCSFSEPELRNKI